MALWMTAFLAFACLGPLVTPGPVPRPLLPPVALKELIEELDNITQDQKTPLCNSSMVWSMDLTGGGYCAALQSLANVTNCSAIHKVRRILTGLCTRKTSPRVSSPPDTKIEVVQFVKTLLTYSKKLFRTAKFD